MRRAAALFGLLALAASAFGAVIYTDEPSFLGAIQPGYYLEDFSSWVYGDPIPNVTGAITDYDFGPVNGWSWHAYAALDLWSNDSSLSVGNAYDPLVLTFPGGDVTAFACILASTDISGNIIPQDITILLDDGTTYTVNGEGFVGFTSDIPIVSATVDADDNPELNWVQIDHVYVGAAAAGAAIPEPATLTLLGLGALGILARRRRK